MTDQENAEWLRDRAGLIPSLAETWVKAAMEIIAAAREEGRQEERERWTDFRVRLCATLAANLGENSPMIDWVTENYPGTETGTHGGGLLDELLAGLAKLRKGSGY